MADKTIVCSECQQPFIHSEGAQQFFKAKGFTQDPKRCKPCRDKKKEAHKRT